MGYHRARAIQAAQRIIEHGGYCAYEACLDVPQQVWEARVLIFDLIPAAVADTLAAEIELEPEYDGRLTGCDRRTLRPDPGMGAYLCYLSEELAPSQSP